MSSRCAEIRELPERPYDPITPIREKFALELDAAVLNRLRLGTLRYGSVYNESGDALLRRLKDKLKVFVDTRNHEMLVDIIVYCHLLWRFDDSPRAHFKPLDQSDVAS